MTEIQKSNVSPQKPEHFWIDMVCRGCGKCVRACPAGIDIPALLTAEERISAGEDEHTVRAECHERWKKRKIQDGQPIDCIECGICSMRCPQGFHLLEIVRMCAIKQLSGNDTYADDEI